MHAFGGGDLTDRNTVSAKRWEYTPGGLTGWVEKPDFINPGDHVSTVVMDGKIYAVAGEHDHSVTTRPPSLGPDYRACTRLTRAARKLRRSTFWEGQLPQCIHQNHILGVRFDLSALLPALISAHLCTACDKA